MILRFIIPIFVITPVIRNTFAAEVPHILVNGTTTPPRLVEQPSRDVWFMGRTAQHDLSGTEFVLPCKATGDPESYTWMKNGYELTVDNHRIEWQRPRQEGSIIIKRPTVQDEGYYQCFVRNMFGTAVSNKVHVQLGALNHYTSRGIKEVKVNMFDPLTLKCDKPYGVPEPRQIWLIKNEENSRVMESINREHISVDGDGNLQFSFVELHDGREDILYECVSASPLLTNSHRAGPKTRIIVSDKTSGNSFMRRRLLWGTPSEVEVRAGERLKLMCIYSGYPYEAPSWHRLNGDLPKNRLVADADYGKSLIIEPVRTTDAGKYECRVTGAPPHVINVHVEAAPFWLSGPPIDINRAEESTAELRCDASGDPTPIFTWYINGKPLTSELDNVEGVMDLEGGRLLRIEGLQRHHTAVYQCNASSPLGYVFANAFINVEAYPPMILSPLNQTLRVVRDKTIDIDCVVRAAPIPLVKLVNKDDRIIKELAGKLRIFPNNTIRIENLQFSDSGLYYCNVSNKYGINRATTHLEVYEPSYMTSFIKKLGQQMLNAGEGRDLSCTAVSDPRLKIEYIWHLNGEPIDFNETKHYYRPQPNQLQLRAARGRHSGRYDCIARTVVDQVVDSITLTVTDIPEPPVVTSVKCGTHSHASAIVEWEASVSNNENVTRYKVEQATAFHPNDWRLVFDIDPKTYPENTRKFKVEVQLSPWVNYTFRVIAINKQGPSAPGTLKAKCSTDPAFPEKNPESVSADGDASDNLVIYWHKMEKEDWNGEGFHYFVRYRLDEPGVEWTEFEVEDPQQERAPIRDQPTYRRYQVQVGCKNLLGKSLVEPEIVTGYSGEDTPAVAPTNFELIKVHNATTAEFSWTAVDENTVNGHFRGYKVEVIPMGMEILNRGYQGPTIDPVTVSHYVNPMTTQVMVSGLLPMQRYFAHVVVQNSLYSGPPSNKVEIETPEGVPTEVVDLEAVPYGANVIYVTWKEPQDVMGILKGYFINFQNLETNAKLETFVDYRYTSYKYVEADEFTAYNVSVWGETGGGEGPNVTKTVHTWPATAPGQPDLAYDILGSQSVKAYWLPDMEHLPGTAFYMNYSVLRSGTWHQTEHIEIPDRYKIIDDLEPNKEYFISVVSVDGNRTTASPLHKFTTPNYGPQHVAPDYMTSAAWFIAILCAVAVALTSLIVVCIRQNRGGRYPVKQKELEHGAYGFKDIDDEDRQFMEYQYGGYEKQHT